MILSPFSNIKNASSEKAENVVKEPNIPICIKGLILSVKISAFAKLSYNIPSIKDPKTLQANIPYGKAFEDKFWIAVDIIYLEVAPIAPPIAIDIIKYIFLALLNYNLKHIILNAKLILPINKIMIKIKTSWDRDVPSSGQAEAS